MTEYGDLIHSSFGRANPVLPPVVGNIDEDPDKAQRAVDLAKATGVPGSLIFNDLEEFERQHKAAMASALVANNPHLQDFVASDPMIPKLANDSYGSLDALSQQLDEYGLVGHFKFNWAERKPMPEFMQGLGEWALHAPGAQEHPELARAVGAIASPVEAALRAIPAAVSSATEALLGKEAGEKTAEVMLDPGLQATLMGLGPPGAMMAGVLGAAAKARGKGSYFPEAPAGEVRKQAAANLFRAAAIEQGGGSAAYFKNGRLPPPGVVPEIDKLRAEHTADDVAKLKEITQEAQSSPLWERNPELAKQFIAMKDSTKISVSADAVMRLYGDKLPEADDGILGWVPQIAEQLELARETGSYVKIPLADWATKIDPKIAQELYDDVIPREGGISKNEAKVAAEVEAVGPRAEPLPGEVPQVRAASALEPMFSVGDRKLELQRLASAAGSKFGPEQGFHDFSINDEKGNAVGTINLSEQKGGKQLFVEMINGINGLGPRDFGPALMRSLLAQLRAEFPNAESITGHRVSGMREKMGTWEAKSAQPVVKLDNPDVRDFRQVLEGGRWESFTPNMRAYIKPIAERSLDDRHLIDIVNDELARIVPQKVYAQPADRIVADSSKGQGARQIEPRGSYIRYHDMYPIILYSLEHGDPLGTARHEAIHHLRNYGFFTPQEWSILEAASQEHGWIDRFRIEQRYPKGDRALKLEESIADAYKHWEAGAMAPTPELHGIFEKMKAFFARIRERIAQMLGKEPTWEDIFQRVSTGEVGGRESTRPLEASAYDERLSVPEEGGSRNAERAAALGVSKETFKKYDANVQAEQAADMAAAEKRAMEEQGRKQTKEWKANRKSLRQEVAADIKGRPDVAADLFFGAGELYGKKVSLASVKLDESALTPEQKAALPPQYYGAKGLNPDDVANLFGYGSGQAMLDHLTAYNQAKMTAGMSARDFVSRVTDIETDRQMQLRYGNLEKNILDAVNEQVTSEVAQDRLHAQLNVMREQLGMAPEDELTRANVRQQLRDKFAAMPLGTVSSADYMRAAAKTGHQIESGLLDAKSHEAFGARLQQYYATVLAREAMKVEAEQVEFAKLAKKYVPREVPRVDPQYANFAQDILGRVGHPARRSIQDLATEIAAGEYKNLADFVQGKRDFYGRELDVDEFLQDPSFRKAFMDLTVAEFRGLHDSIKSLDHNGRAELKIESAGKLADLNEKKGEMVTQIHTFEEKKFDAKGGRKMLDIIPAEQAALLRTFGLDHLQMETILNRWDAGDPNGVFQQYVMRGLVTAANSESAKRRIYADRLLALDDGADLRGLVDNPLFKVPGTEQLMQFTRANLRAILLNVGNDSNLTKLAKGYDVPKEQVIAWVHTHATKADWDWAQKIGGIFKDLGEDSSNMYRQLSGRAPELIELKPIDTPHGQYDGWYYPLIAHPEFEGAAKKAMGPEALEQQGFVRATTQNGYTKDRTGVMYPLALDIDMMPNRIGQMIHDIEMRPAIINASKIFYDKDVRQAIATRFGNEWRDMLVPYLVDVANAANYMPKNQRRMAAVSEFLRKNMVTTLVGLNPGTFLKHTPTALVQSIHEVGAKEFLTAVRGLWSINEATGERNWDFAMRMSEELQRRHTHFRETLGGATDALMPTKGFDTLRNTVAYYASYPVAMGDLASAVPTWLAEFNKQRLAGATEGDAVYMADRAVRRAHGSSAITNRSAVMRGGYSPWLASVYGFFNHIMNRQYEMLWKSGEALDMIKNKEGTYELAMKDGRTLTANLWAYVVAPAVIEELISPLSNEEGESWGKKAAKGLAYTLSSSWIVVRDVANAVMNGKDPSFGLASTAFKSLTDVVRDAARDRPLSKEHAGKLIKDGATLIGTGSGLMPAEVGKLAEFGYGVHTGVERPRGPWGWMTGARFGTLKGHPATFDEWQRHHFGGRR